MGKKAVTRAMLAEAVHQKTNISRSDAADVVDFIIEDIMAVLAEGETVRIASFGVFEVRQKNRRLGRNPKTGEEVPIEARQVVTFRPSDVLKRFINNEAATL